MNSYQKEFKAAARGYNSWEVRDRLTKQYAWAIPNDEALAELRKHAPFIEIGAGKGYWASLLDVDIICFDAHAKSPVLNTCVDNGANYHKVVRGGADKVLDHPERTLFLCWPPPDTSMAADCLAYYTGDVLAYVGEGFGGCNGDSAFWLELEKEWDVECYVSIPSWFWIHDDLTIYRRKV